ncbi:MAG TPA: hypothetical protein VHO69_11875, partial [Phototrophicaceae bacterium]|nr:hypothetical protein [Phototrophicaceae bacterium]
MGQGQSRIYNLISLVFLVLTVVVIIVAVMQFLRPAAAQPQAAADLPTPFVLPTMTPSNTPTNTQPPTFTFTPTETATPTVTATTAPTVTATSTITDTPGPTDTPSVTPTPSTSPTPTPTETPTGPTNTPSPTTSPFPYDVRDGQVIYTTNFANTAGCAWQGVGGQVYDINNNAVNGMQIHIFNAQIGDRTVTSGSNSLYGPGGWEQPVDNKINNNTYFVELLSAAGTPIS